MGLRSLTFKLQVSFFKKKLRSLIVFLDNYRPAVFSVRVNKANVSENEKLWLRENIAYFLALNLSK